MARGFDKTRPEVITVEYTVTRQRPNGTTYTETAIEEAVAIEYNQQRGQWMVQGDYAGGVVSVYGDTENAAILAYLRLRVA